MDNLLSHNPESEAEAKEPGVKGKEPGVESEKSTTEGKKSETEGKKSKTNGKQLGVRDRLMAKFNANKSQRFKSNMKKFSQQTF